MNLLHVHHRVRNHSLVLTEAKKVVAQIEDPELAEEFVRRWNQAERTKRKLARLKIRSKS